MEPFTNENYSGPFSSTFLCCRFLMLQIWVLTFECVDLILKWEHSIPKAIVQYFSDKKILFLFENFQVLWKLNDLKW